MSVKRLDVDLFIIAMIVMVTQWATNTGWLVIPFAVLLTAGLVIPARWEWRIRR